MATYALYSRERQEKAGRIELTFTLIMNPATKKALTVEAETIEKALGEASKLLDVLDAKSTPMNAFFIGEVVEEETRGLDQYSPASLHIVE